MHEILHGVLTHKKNKIWGGKKFGGPPLPNFLVFFVEKHEKCLELPEMVRKLIGIFFGDQQIWGVNFFGV
jgi:hypothetical protein